MAFSSIHIHIAKFLTCLGVAIVWKGESLVETSVYSSSKQGKPAEVLSTILFKSSSLGPSEFQLLKKVQFPRWTIFARGCKR